MRIVDFTEESMVQAQKLALECYREERCQSIVLPEIGETLELAYFAGNNMGVAAFEGERLLGFLGGTEPFDHAFGSTDVKGVFSPMGAHAAVAENRSRIYCAMYQEAAAKWVKAKAVSHAICLYAHDEITKQQFFRYGFGLRCVDGIRPMETISCMSSDGYEFFELPQAEYSLVYPLKTMLNRHYQKSPFFMNRDSVDKGTFCSNMIREGDRCFAAEYKGDICAYLQIAKCGETFIAEHPAYRHINGAYCLKEHRGNGVYQNLLNYVIRILKNEGFTQLGVDFESINPTAYGFWSKYFTLYTNGVVRRIDERILAL